MLYEEVLRLSTCEKDVVNLKDTIIFALVEGFCCGAHSLLGGLMLYLPICRVWSSVHMVVHCAPALGLPPWLPMWTLKRGGIFACNCSPPKKRGRFDARIGRGSVGLQRWSLRRCPHQLHHKGA